MAPTGQFGPSFIGASSNYQNSGVGGKFRKSIIRKSTPYDRPITATRTPSWLSKLVVDPAAKLRNFGAHRFFSWVFSNKRISPPPDEEQETRNELHETALALDAGVQEPVADVCGTSTSNHATSGLPELEHLLKQKTFTRYEIDHLTELLKSRASEFPDEADKHGAELNHCGQDSVIHQEFPATSNINKSECLGSHGAVLELAVTTREQDRHQHFGDQVASPAELAKSYMSNRPAKVPSSTLNPLSQNGREDSVPPTRSPYTSKSQLSALPVKTSGYSAVPTNGFTTPRSRGRSAIYNMARTPYSRFHPVDHQKVSGSKYCGDSRPPLFGSRPASENGGEVSLKSMALKRRSTVLDDDDNGSIGPIRRIRQKHNLLPHGKSVTISGKGIGSDFTHSPNPPFMGSADTRGASTSSANYAHVPRESSEMAAKILEHLEKMTPKVKSPESKSAAAREGSTCKLTPHMLRGQALRSMEDLGASKLLQDSLKDHKLVDQPVRSLPKSHEFTTQKLDSLEEKDPVKYVKPEVKLTPDRTVQGHDNSSLGYGAMLSFSSQPPEKKLPFKMSAHEDWIDMDDDNGNDLVPESAEKGMVNSMRDINSAFNEDKTLDKSKVSLERTHANPVLNGTELEGCNVMSGEKKSGFNLPTPFAPNSRSQKVLSQLTKVDDSPIFLSSGSETTRNNPTSVDPNVETSSSLKIVSFGATNAVVGVPESDSSGTKNSELDNPVNGSLGKPPSFAFNHISTNNIISVDAPSSNLASNGGPLTSSVSLSFSSYAPDPVNFTSNSVTKNSSNIESSARATTSTSALSDSVLVPANGAYSSFSEDVSDNSSSKKIFLPPTIGSTKATDVKAENVNGLCSFSNSTTINTSAVTNTGSSILGVGTSVSSSAVNSQWPGTASGTTVSKESSFTGSGSGNVSLSTPVHFGSSSSAMGFGLSGTTPHTSSSIFQSSVPVTKSEDVTQSCSASASNPVNSINVAAPVTFKFGGGASASTEGNTFSSTSTGSLGTFQFGASSATLTSSSSSPGSSLFSFGAGSSAATSVSKTTSPAFNFSSGTAVSSSSANPTISSITAPAVFSFGSSAPAPSSESNKVISASSTFGSPFSIPSSTGFSVGGSSSAFGTSNSSMVFGSTTGVSSNPAFSFSAAMPSPLLSAGTQSVFGNSASPFTASPGNNNQMGGEDCMAEDPIQSSTPTAPAFGQSFVSPQPVVSPSPPGFMFASAAPSPAAPFQFASQQGQFGQQNPSQFQASASSEFNPGGGFSLGSGGGGGDKSGRRFVKVSNKSRNRKR